MRILVVPAFFALAICAQAAPQFVWQGQVDGVAILHLRGRSLTVQTQQGGPVERQKYRFSDALPDVAEDARVEVLGGRGSVHVIDQPSLDNHYTLAVEIEDRQQGSSFYSIALYWDTSTNEFERGLKTDRVVWKGRVDRDTVVTCYAKTCTSNAQPGGAGGAPVAEQHFKFSKPLPERDTEVRLVDPDGRGEIRLIDQPREDNHYTASVSIHDPGPGSSDYSFALVWNRAGGKGHAEESAPITPPTGRGMLWSGTVDGRVRVTVQGGASFSEVIDGAHVTGESAQILRPLPARLDVMPVLRKIHGRGQAMIVEKPSEQNHYRLVFEIDDPEPGADTYEVELDW